MKIFIPVPVTKRLPEAKQPVLVRYTNISVSPEWSALCLAICDKKGRWESTSPEQREKFDICNQVVEWYQEVELDSMFPDNDISYFMAKNAADNRIHGIMLHQEGQIAVKNYFMKKINGNGNNK